MLSIMPFGFLFIFILIFSTIFSLSSIHWLGIWIGLEINLMSFIPILVVRGMTQETESGMKYFLIQALGSGMLMTGSLLAFKTSLSWETTTASKPVFGLLLLIFALLLKLGSFPFHFWLPGVMAGLSWMNCLILTTWQKLAPIFLLSAFAQSMSNISWLMNFMLLLAGFSSLLGGIGGLNQTQIRALLAYSSISHVGWMVFCSVLNQNTLKLYFLIYFTISVCIFVILWSIEISFFTQTSVLSRPEGSKLNEICLIFMLLSLGGMPPFLGFVGKWLTISSSCSISFSMNIMLLLLGSLISLFYYLSLLFSTTFFSGLSLTSKTLAPLTQYPSIYMIVPINPHNKLPAGYKNYSHYKYYAHMYKLMKMTTIMILTFNFIGGLLISFMLPVTDFF